jgi:hypothetical protein
MEQPPGVECAAARPSNSREALADSAAAAAARRSSAASWTDNAAARILVYLSLCHQGRTFQATGAGRPYHRQILDRHWRAGPVARLRPATMRGWWWVGTGLMAGCTLNARRLAGVALAQQRLLCGPRRLVLAPCPARREGRGDARSCGGQAPRGERSAGSPVRQKNAQGRLAFLRADASRSCWNGQVHIRKDSFLLQDTRTPKLLCFDAWRTKLELILELIPVPR